MKRGQQMLELMMMMRGWHPKKRLQMMESDSRKERAVKGQYHPLLSSEAHCVV